MRILLAFCLSCCLLIVSAQNYYLFVGTYTGGKSKGIYVFQFNAKNGEVQWVSNTDSADNPSFLAIAPDGKHLYSVNETDRDHSGKVSAYSFDAANGSLHLLNQVASGSENPCHVSITHDGKWIAVANYTGGSLAMFPVNSDGSLKPYTQHIIHKGKSVNPVRQEKAHVHSVFFSPDEHFLYTPDLGMDKVTVYRFNPQSKKPLSPAPVPYISTTPGAGPRHISFSPDKKFLYLIEEMGGSVNVYQYANGSTRFVQRIATHPDQYTGLPGSADIHLSPDGKFLYASNRGDENNIAIFSVDKQTGKLTHIGYQPCGGLQPRNFIIEPTGNFLLVANQKTNNIVVYRRDKETGLLQATLQQIEVPSPVCLQMLAK